MLPQVFEEIFELAGTRLRDHLEFMPLNPMYRLRFGSGKDLTMYFDKHQLREELERVFPGSSRSYDAWYSFHTKKFARVYDCLKIPYQRWFDYANPKLLRALPYLQAHRSLWSVLDDYFVEDEMKMAMAFQAKYLGMSPWDCPGTFSILSYIEHAFGVYHIKGGVHTLSTAMADVARANGATIHCSTPVKKILTEGKRAIGVLLENGERVLADNVVMNADFAAGMTELLDEAARPHFSNKNLEQREYSCSTFMLYLGVDKQYDIPHHNIFFGKNYKENVRQIAVTKQLPNDPAFYIQNAAHTDPTVAPAGHSTIYVLVPVPNLTADIDWKKEASRYRDLVLDQIEQRTELKDLRQHIVVERVITPHDWQASLHVYEGAVFNLAHSLNQMLYLRPHNRFNDISNMYIVGGGTHPGSGLPTILESGRIAADLMSK
jgi:phytoene desaturase